MEGEDGEDFVPPKPATPVWAGYTLTNVLTVNWHIAEHASDYEIRENLNWGNAVGLVFRGYAHSLSFIPKSREFIQNHLDTPHYPTGYLAKLIARSLSLLK